MIYLYRFFVTKRRAPSNTFPFVFQLLNQSVVFDPFNSLRFEKNKEYLNNRIFSKNK